MTFIEIIDFASRYGMDVAVLSFVTTALTQILKKTVLKKAPAKIYAFLPFIIGCVLYAVYSALCAIDPDYAGTDVGAIIKHGVDVGAVATVIYVIYGQFVRGKQSGGEGAIIAAMLEGFVDGNHIESTAAELCELFGGEITDDSLNGASAALKGKTLDGVSDAETELALRLIAEVIRRTRADKS